MASPNFDALFLRTLSDLEVKSQSHDTYDLLGTSALLRKLFLDDFRLVDRVNRTRRVKLRFRIADMSRYLAMVLKSGAQFYSTLDALDPDRAPPFCPRIDLTRDQFFGTVVLVAGGSQHTIREVILFHANVMGGVHAGTPATEKARALVEVEQLFALGGIDGALRQLQSIGNVALQALKPLRDSVSESGGGG
jgi:hypothetical protein